MNNNRNLNGLSFIAGLIIGGASIYYLNTPQGKRLTKQVKDKTIEFSDAAMEKASEVQTQIKEKVSVAKELANEAIEASKTTLVNTGKTIKNKAQDMLPENQTAKDFKEGVKAAKVKMNGLGS